MRGLNAIVEMLASGEIERFVLIRGSEMVAVIHPIESCPS